MDNHAMKTEIYQELDKSFLSFNTSKLISFIIDSCLFDYLDYKIEKLDDLIFKLPIKDRIIFNFHVLDIINRTNNQELINKAKLFDESANDFPILMERLDLINNNLDNILDLLKSNPHFRKLFFDNMSFVISKNKYSFELNYIRDESFYIYLLSCPEFIEGFNNISFIQRIFGMSNDVLLNIPVEYRKKMAYITFDDHSTYAKITCETNLFRIITLFYPFLNRDEVSEIISYYSKSGLSNDKLEFLFDSLTKNNDFYKLLIELKNKCFNNVSETINFIRKYKTTNLYRELNELSEVDDELKQKLIFLSSANRLKGISSLEDINKVSIDELKNIKNDDEYVSNIRINVDPHAHKNDKKFKVFNHKRSIVLIDSDETFEEFEVNLSHLDIIKRIYIEKDIPYYKLDEHKMYYNLALMDYVVMVIDEDTIAIYFPSKLSETQKEILIDRFSDVSKNELYISAGFVDEDHKYFLINPLNNGEFMDRNKFLDELNRINCKEKNRN